MGIQKYDHLPAKAVTFSEMLGFLIPTVLAMLVGKLVDVWGASKVHALALLLGCVVAPVPLFFWWAYVPQSFAVLAVWIGQGILGLLLALTTSVYLWVVELFPVRVRTTGVSVAYNIGIGIFGGLGPLISDAGNEVISPKSPLSAPAIYMLCTGLLSLLAIIAGQVLSRRGLMRLTHLRAAPY